MKRYTTRTRDGGFSGHDKRVTLNLARLSATCAEMPELLAVLESLPAVDYDLTQLPQASLELLYAEFDEELEVKVKSEFEADPSYLDDLRIPTGTCPLCGHQGCRFIFRIVNLKGGRSVECGSECIITYGLSVRGAETAEHARKLLEKAIRKAIRKGKVEDWHTEYEFRAEHFRVVSDSFQILCDHSQQPVLSYGEWRTARHLRDVELPRLERFYERSGWLGTKLRWGKWLKIVEFVQTYDSGTHRLPDYKPWEPKAKRGRKAGGRCMVKVDDVVIGELTNIRPVPRINEEVFQLNLWSER